MTPHDDLRPELRQRADDMLRQLTPREREALLVKCWMSHDARWFMAVARECGMEVANRLNRIAAHELGRVEAQRIVRALGLSPVASLDDYLLVQEVLIGLLGPDLLDYGVSKVNDHAYRVQVRRCFAHENAERAGIADQLKCGIFARVTGWLDGVGLAHEALPPLGKCLKAQRRECEHTITLARR
ncbi:MAG: hypothetical protein HY727_18925 [Candidatus Rokubacteria bacterium]|nr:hypothetical protein [Candidatus Rokubacteria bacterium]